MKTPHAAALLPTVQPHVMVSVMAVRANSPVLHDKHYTVGAGHVR